MGPIHIQNYLHGHHSLFFVFSHCHGIFFTKSTNKNIGTGTGFISLITDFESLADKYAAYIDYTQHFSSFQTLWCVDSDVVLCGHHPISSTSAQLHPDALPDTTHWCWSFCHLALTTLSSLLPRLALTLNQVTCTSFYREVPCLWLENSAVGHTSEAVHVSIEKEGQC